MQDSTAIPHTLPEHLVDEIERRLLDAEKQTHPLEIEPYRGQIFELFVMAEAAGLVDEGAEPDLTADGICQVLSLRWGLSDAAQSSVEQQTALSRDHLDKMRLLWSFMRLWMEWTYAWQRWPEFHQDRKPAKG